MNESPDSRRLWLAILPALLIPGLAAFAYFDWLGGHPLAQAVYAGAKVFILVWPVLATLLIIRQPIRPRLRPLSRHLRAVPLGLLIGLPIAALMWIWMQVPLLADVVHAGADGVNQKVSDLGFLDHFIPFAIYVTLFHSLLEEYYWRWFVYGKLRGVVSLPAAHLIAGVAFALHHIAVTMQFFPIGWALFFSLSVGVGGVFWSLLYQKQGTLAGAWASHAVVDAALMVLGWHLLNG